MYLLDTNVVSEAMRKKPNPAVADWIDRQHDEDLHLAVVTIAEIDRGISLLSDGPRREQLNDWLEKSILPRFGSRVLHVDLPIARCWGRLMAASQSKGRALAPLGAFIAATVLAHGLVLVTRNIRDFEGLGLDLLDPWQAS